MTTNDSLLAHPLVMIPYTDSELVLGFALISGTIANRKQAEDWEMLIHCGILSWCSLEPCSHHGVRQPGLATGMWPSHPHVVPPSDTESTVGCVSEAPLDHPSWVIWPSLEDLPVKPQNHEE